VVLIGAGYAGVMFDFFTDNRLAGAFFKIGALSLVFGFKEAACLTLGYCLIYWAIGGQSDWK
jgi:hypothetical protein